MAHQKILLFYEKNHTKHPFINLLIKYLSQCVEPSSVITASFASVKEVGSHSFISLNDWIHRKANNGRPFEQAYGSRGMSLKLIKSAIEIFGQHKPDVIITFLPVGFIAGQLYRLRRNCRTVYFPFEIYGRQHSKFSRKVVLAEKLGFMLKPDAFITQNESRAQFYLESRHCRNRPNIAHNYKETPSVQAKDLKVFSRHGIPDNSKVVLYQGMLTEGRWLDRLIHAARYLDEEAVLVLMGPKQQPWWDSTIQPMLADPRLAGRVFVLESVPHEMVSSYARAAALGVIIYDDSVLNNVYCEPGKIGDFVHAGVPVVAPGFPSIKPVIEKNRLGTVFDDFSSRGIANAMNKALALPKEEFATSLAMASEFMTWEAQWPALKSAILGERQGSEC